MELIYGTGVIVSPPPDQIEKYEPKEYIELANSILKEQSNKKITTPYSQREDMLFINNHLNLEKPLKFKLLPNSNYCGISDFTKLSLEQNHYSSDRLRYIFILCKSYKLQLLDYEKKGEEFGRKIKVNLEKNQKDQAVRLIDTMIEEFKNRNRRIINNLQYKDLERLHGLLYCYNISGIKTFVHLKKIVNLNEPSDILLEEIISYFKNKTNEEDRKVLAISSELIRIDELFGLYNIRVGY